MAHDDSRSTEGGPPQDRMARLRAEIAHLRRRLDDIIARQPMEPLPPAPAPAVGTALAITALPPVTPPKPSPEAPVADAVASPAPASEVSPSTSPMPNTPASPPAPAGTAMTAPPPVWSPARQARNGFDVALHLARRPGFCCCCLCLQPIDARRAKRIFAIVRAVRRAEKTAARKRASI